MPGEVKIREPEIREPEAQEQERKPGDWLPLLAAVGIVGVAWFWIFCIAYV